jgi:hypothetical protein
MRFAALLVTFLAAASSLNAQTFQMVLCNTPVGSGSFQPI